MPYRVKRERIRNIEIDYIALRQRVFKIYDGRVGGDWVKMAEIIQYLPETPEFVVKRYYMALVNAGLAGISMRPRESPAEVYALVDHLLRLVEIRASAQIQIEREARSRAKEPLCPK